MIDIFRATQKLSQYCSQGMSFEDMHSVFSKFIKVMKNVKSLFLRENPQTITRELFEKSLEDVMYRHKVVDNQKGVIIEKTLIQ